MQEFVYKADLSKNWEKAKTYIPKKDLLIYYTDLDLWKKGDGINTVENLNFLEKAHTLIEIEKVWNEIFKEGNK